MRKLTTIRAWALALVASIALAAAAVAQTTTDSSGPGLLSPNGTVTEPYRLVTATIASSGSLAGAVDLGEARMVGLVMPAAWDAAGITFQCSKDNSTFYNVYYDDGTEVSWTVDASRYVLTIFPTRWLACRYLKIRSGTAGSPVTQSAARTLTVVAAP